MYISSHNGKEYCSANLKYGLYLKQILMGKKAFYRDIHNIIKTEMKIYYDQNKNLNYHPDLKQYISKELFNKFKHEIEINYKTKLTLLNAKEKMLLEYSKIKCKL